MNIEKGKVLGLTMNINKKFSKFFEDILADAVTIHPCHAASFAADFAAKG